MTPVRGITLEEVAAGVRDEVHQETALHDRHLKIGATMEPSGAWRRPRHYGDALGEYWAVRQGVSVMDVGTLGKIEISPIESARTCKHAASAARLIHYVLQQQVLGGPVARTTLRKA